MKTILALAIGFALLGPIAAHADTLIYDFTATGPGVSSSGTITAITTSTPGVYDVTDITGNVNGETITSLLPGSYDINNPTYNDSTDNFYFDNLLYTTAPVLDLNGIGFDLGTTGDQGNFFFDTPEVYSDPAAYDFFSVYSGVNSDTVLTSFTLTETQDIPATPEPSTLVLLGTGVLGLAGVLRRRLLA